VISALSAVWKLTGITPMETLILLRLCDRANEQGRCWPGLASLVRDTKAARRTIQTCIDRLVEQRHISIAKPNTITDPTTYQLSNYLMGKIKNHPSAAIAPDAAIDPPPSANNEHIPSAATALPPSAIIALPPGAATAPKPSLEPSIESSFPPNPPEKAAPSGGITPQAGKGRVGQLASSVCLSKPQRARPAKETPKSVWAPPAEAHPPIPRTPPELPRHGDEPASPAPQPQTQPTPRPASSPPQEAPPAAESVPLQFRSYPPGESPLWQNPLFVSIAAICGLTRKNANRSAVQDVSLAMVEILEVAPNITPQDITLWRARCLKQWPKCRITPGTFRKHFNQFYGEPTVPVESLATTRREPPKSDPTSMW
jgi:hypothetical protein